MPSTFDMANYPLAVAPRGVSWGQQRFDYGSRSVPSGTRQDRLGGFPAWTMSLVAPEGIQEADAAIWRELLLNLDGSVNYFKAWNPSQPILRGTMRGTQTLNGAHSGGVGALNIIVTGTGEVGKTILSGSPLTLATGIGTSQLVHTVGDAVAVNTGGNSTITVNIKPATRIAFANGTTVTYDKAFTYWKQRSPGNVRWTHYDDDNRIQHDFALDLIEVWN